MAVCTANFETGTTGSNILTSDAGSVTPWNTRSVIGASLTYSNDHSFSTPLSGLWVFPGSSAQCYVQWDTALGTVTDHYGRLYLYMAAYPTGGISDYLLEFFNGAAETAGWVIVPSTGVLRAKNAISGNQTGTVPISLNQFVRIEWHIVHSTTVGVVEVKLFNNPQSLTPSETITFSGTNTGTQATAMMVGSNNTTTQASTIWMDNIIGGVTTGYPGPFLLSGLSDVPFVPLGRGAA